MSPIPIIRASCARLAEQARDPRLKRLVRVAGWAALLVALAYLAQSLLALDWRGLGTALDQTAWIVTLMCSIAYAMMLLVLARGWAVLADQHRRADRRGLVVIYGLGVVAKYLPGSVFQYAARQVQGARAGLSQGDMGRASLLEAALHVPAALLAGGVLWARGGLATLVAVMGLAVLVWFIARGTIVRTAACQALFFAAMAAQALCLARWGLGAADAERLAAAFMLSWVAGFLVPVAPGGLGVREAAFLALAGAGMPTDSAVIAGQLILLMRVVTTVGDAVLGLAAYGLVLLRRENRHASA